MGVVFRREDKMSFGHFRTSYDHIKEGEVSLAVFSHGHVYFDLKIEDWIYFLGCHWGTGQGSVLLYISHLLEPGFDTDLCTFLQEPKD